MFSKKEFDDIVSVSAEIMASAYLWRMTDIPIAAMMLYTKLADCHKRRGEFTLALELLQLSLVLAQKLDRADICPQKLSGQVPKELFDSKFLEIQNQIALLYCNLSRIYCMMEQYVKAVSASKESLRLSEKLGNREQVIKSRQSIGRCLFWTGNYEDALVLHVETLSIVHKDDLFVSEYSSDVDFVREKFETIVLLKLQIARCHSVQCCFEAAIDIRKEVWELLREMSLQCNVCTVSLDCQGCNQFKILTCIAIGIDLRSRAHVYTVTDKESKNTKYMQTLHEASHWFETAIGLSYCHNLMYIKNDVLLHLAFNLFEIGSEELGMAKLKKHLDTQLTIKNKVCMGCALGVTLLDSVTKITK
jgi:tetratricopeptide (TPR) repeat protein